jgi:hypothetical protein
MASADVNYLYHRPVIGFQRGGLYIHKVLKVERNFTRARRCTTLAGDHLSFSLLH